MTQARWLALAVAILLSTTTARGDVFRPAYLEIIETSPDHYDVLWKTPLLPDGGRIDATVRVPDAAGSLDKRRGVRAANAWTQRYELAYPAGTADRAVSIEGLRGSVTNVLVKVKWLNGESDVVRLPAKDATFTIPRKDGERSIRMSYVWLGIVHILNGVDHLLFVTALLLITRVWRNLIATITSFTLGHSVTLAAATFGWVSVPSSLAEALIALSIVFVAAEGLRGNAATPRQTQWLLAGGFGLLHGLGFASALADIGHTGAILPALLMFNIGVEIGQLIFVTGIVMAGFLLKAGFERFAGPARRVTAYGIGVISAFWTFERIAAF